MSGFLLDEYPAGSTIYAFFHTFSSTGAAVTISGLATTDIEIYKDGSTTQRASDSGFALLDTDGIDIDSLTGIQGISIDLSDNTTAGFYAEASIYHVVLASITVDSQTVNFVLGSFRITPAVDVSDLHSLLTLVRSDTTHIESDVVRIESDTQSLASDLAEGDFSDILSRLTVTNSQLLIVKSDTSDIRSFLTVINAIVSDIQSDTNVMVPIVSDIQSDTNVLVTKMRGLVLATGTIGATGNTTTAIHIPDAVLDSLSDDEIKNYNVVIYDNSLDEYHVRTITAWTNVGDLATVSPALPFTPEASVDLYWVLPPVANQFDYDMSDLQSLLTLVRSDTTHIESDAAAVETIVSDIQSDTNKLVSDATEVDTSDILSMLTKVYSDTTAIHTQTTAIASDTTTLASDLAEADFSDLSSLLTKVYSDTTAIHTQTTAIQSDTQSLASDLQEGDFSDILSRLTLIHSETTAIQENTSDTESMLLLIRSDTTAIEGTVGGGEGDISDILSRLTVTNSQLLVIKSDTSDVISALVKVYSDTTLATGTNSLPAQGAPSASATERDMIAYLYKAWRNKTTQTSSEYALYAADGTTKDHEAVVSDDGTTTTRGEVGTGA
jgi:hypothetical protein